MSENLKLSIDDWKVKKEQRSRGRMKFTIKLSKEEAEAFKNWLDAVKPEGMDEDTIYKTIFFNGIEFLNKQLADIAMQALEKQKQEELAKQQTPEQQ